MAVIVLAIAIIVMMMIMIGVMILFFDSRDDIEQARETSLDVQNDRLKENIIITSDNGTISIGENWAGKTRITGVMIKCEDGSTFTSSIANSPGDTLNHTEERVQAAVDGLRWRCS